MSFDCKYCFLVFPARYERYRHFKEGHPDEYNKGKGRCFLCNKECPNFMKFFDHVEEDHEIEAYQLKMRSTSYEEREQGEIVLGAWMLTPGYLKEGDGPISLNEIARRNRRLRRNQDGEGDYSSEEEDEEEDWPASTSAANPSEQHGPIEPQPGVGDAPPTSPSPAPTEGYLDDAEMDKEDEEIDVVAVEEEVDVKPIISGRMPSTEEVYALYHYNDNDDEEENGEEQSESRKRRHSEDPIEAAKKHRGLTTRNPNVPLDAPISVITETIEKTDASSPATSLPPTEAPLPLSRLSLPPQSSSASSTCSTPHVQQILQQPPQAYPFPSPVQHPMACMEQLANQGRPSSASLVHPPPTREQWLQLQQIHQQQLMLRGLAGAPPPQVPITPQQWNEHQARMNFQRQQQQMMMNQMGMHQMGSFVGTTPSPQNLPMRAPMGMQPWNGSMGHPAMNGMMGMTSPLMGSTYPGTFPALNQTPSPLILPAQQMQFNGFAGPLTPSSMFSNSLEVEKKEETVEVAGSSRSSVSDTIMPLSDVLSIMKRGTMQFPPGTSQAAMIAQITSLGGVVENNNNGQAKLPDDGNNEGFEGMPVLYPPTEPAGMKQSPQSIPSFNPTATIKICESDSTELDQFLPPPTMQLEGRCEGEIPETQQETQDQIMLRIFHAVNGPNQSNLPLANAPPCKTDMEYWNGKLDGNCLRCGSCSATSPLARTTHYKRFHYNVYFEISQSKMSPIEKWLSIRFGPESDALKWTRACLHCPGSRENYMGRGRLLEHIMKSHPDVFVAMGREYTMTFIDTQTTDVNLHRLLVSAAASISVLPSR